MPIDISLVIPCYNAGTLLLDAIESVRGQAGNFRVAEIIVVDDRSDDAATRQALQVASRRARVVVNQRARGPAGARNFGVSLATAPYISFLDADDLLPPGSLAARVDALALAEGPCFVGCDFQMWWGGDAFDAEGFFQSRERPRRLLAEAFDRQAPVRLVRPAASFLEATLCHCGTLLMERSLFGASGGFDESLRFCEDHLFFIRLASRADYVFVPVVGMWYRQHAGSLTHAQFCPSEKYASALKHWLAIDPATPMRAAALQRIAGLEAETAQWYRTQRRFSDALKASWRAVMRDWRHTGGWRQLLASSLRRP